MKRKEVIGKEALKTFESTMTALFRSLKNAVEGKLKPRPKKTEEIGQELERALAPSTPLGTSEVRNG